MLNDTNAPTAASRLDAAIARAKLVIEGLEYAQRQNAQNLATERERLAKLEAERKALP